MNKNNYDKKRSLTGYLMVSPAMILMLIFVFYPLVNLVYLSFFNYNLIGTKEFVGLKNYKILFFIKTDFIQALRNTGVYTLTVVIFSLLSIMIRSNLTMNTIKDKQKTYDYMYFIGFHYLY